MMTFGPLKQRAFFGEKMENKMIKDTLPPVCGEVDLMDLFERMDFCLGNFFYHLAKTLTDDEDTKKEECKLAKEFFHKFNEFARKEYMTEEGDLYLGTDSARCGYYWMRSKFEFLEYPFSEYSDEGIYKMYYSKLEEIEEHLESFVLENGYRQFLQNRLK